MIAPELSLIIPTYNERDSVGPLLAAIRHALIEIDWEVLFVDDSTDGTELVIDTFAAVEERVHLLHRTVNRGGLAGAVVDGLVQARGAYICVLDADLQHPPTRIPEMLRVARTRGAGVVIASRYLPGGSSGGLDGPLRRFFSRALRSLSLAMFPRRLAGITDPLGGFFLLHRSVVEGVALRPIGYKILLEILVRCPWRSSAEIPYAFQRREYGTSKADFRQGLRFLRHLARLGWDCSMLGAPKHVASRLRLPNRPAAARSRP
jgi:glycosyltransferase involved in cell wall biosynthesis